VLTTEKNNLRQSNVEIVMPKYEFLWFLMLSYSMLTALLNWFDARLIELFKITTTPGTLIYPLSFLISGMITEIYGYKYARRAIWAAFFFNILFIVFGQVVINMPSPDFATKNNEAFNKLLSINSRVIVASFIAYLVSEPLNSYIIAKLKIRFMGKFIRLRFITSSILATSIDSLIFVTIVFSPKYNIKSLLELTFNMWWLKSIVELLGLAIAIKLTKKLKQIEKIDVYDFDTSFKPFSLNIIYTQKNNLYKKTNI
jgi:uncharacterized integral membrane protein (TIGR00697 family)